jgi:hypothetical protein
MWLRQDEAAEVPPAAPEGFSGPAAAEIEENLKQREHWMREEVQSII